MRFVFPLLAAASFLPAAALAQDSAADAEPIAARGPITCISGEVPGYVDKDVLGELARGNFIAQGDAQERAYRSVGAAIAACKRRNGWSETRQAAAISYYRGSTMRGNAANQLRDYNVRADQFDAAYRALPEEERTRLVESGAISASAMTAVARAMEGAGATFGTPDAAALQLIGRMIGQGIYGTMLMERAVQDYRNR